MNQSKPPFVQFCCLSLSLGVLALTMLTGCENSPDTGPKSSKEETKDADGEQVDTRKAEVGHLQDSPSESPKPTTDPEADHPEEEHEPPALDMIVSEPPAQEMSTPPPPVVEDPSGRLGGMLIPDHGLAPSPTRGLVDKKTLVEPKHKGFGGDGTTVEPPVLGGGIMLLTFPVGAEAEQAISFERTSRSAAPKDLKFKPELPKWLSWRFSEDRKSILIKGTAEARQRPKQYDVQVLNDKKRVISETRVKIRASRRPSRR